MSSKADGTRRITDDVSVSRTVAFIHKKADSTILKVQQALGRSPSSKGQYMTIHHGEQFNKIHIRLLSVFLFLLCVSSCAIAFGIHYTFKWKPCMKRFYYEKPTQSDTCPTCASDVHKMWTHEKYSWGKNKKYAKNNDSEANRTANVCGDNTP